MFQTQYQSQQTRHRSQKTEIECGAVPPNSRAILDKLIVPDSGNGIINPY